MDGDVELSFFFNFFSFLGRFACWNRTSPSSTTRRAAPCRRRACWPRPSATTAPPIRWSNTTSRYYSDVVVDFQVRSCCFFFTMKHCSISFLPARGAARARRVSFFFCHFYFLERFFAIYFSFWLPTEDEVALDGDPLQKLGKLTWQTHKKSCRCRQKK